MMSYLAPDTDCTDTRGHEFPGRWRKTNSRYLKTCKRCGVEMSPCKNGFKLHPAGYAKMMDELLEADAPPESIVRDIRTRTHCSWSNLWKAVRVLQGQRGIVFGTSNVESTSKSIVRRMIRESGWDIDQLGQFVQTQLV